LQTASQKRKGDGKMFSINQAYHYLRLADTSFFHHIESDKFRADFYLYLELKQPNGEFVQYPAVVTGTGEATLLFQCKEGAEPEYFVLCQEALEKYSAVSLMPLVQVEAVSKETGEVLTFYIQRETECHFNKVAT